MSQTPSVSPDEARAIAKEATIYGFPLIDSYRIQYSYFANRTSPEFKASWNTLINVARVFTPDDKTIQTPNSDTPGRGLAGGTPRAHGPLGREKALLLAAIYRHVHIQFRLRGQPCDWQ